MTAPPLALTMGEPAGIGGELALKAWLALRADDTLPVRPFLVIDDPLRLERLADLPGCAAPIVPIRAPADCFDAFDAGLPVLPLSAPVDVESGNPLSSSAPAVLESIDAAIDLAKDSQIAAVVTNPIQKAPLIESGFGFPGHTEYLQHRASAKSAVMMLVAPMLRVALVTIHLPLSAVPGALTTERIVATGQVAADALQRDFGIAAPRLAVAGLNPHAGEAGTLGHEDALIIQPAIKTLRSAGITATGPHPADTLFRPAARKTYDAAICMYHDQGLAPLKAIHFDAVNVTLGLPFIRTSPDHGTALDLAGTGRASPVSLIAALRLAAAMAARRYGIDDTD
ncbi:MAG: 4-hydroxythreonine-4-phosphate dehydrogenase PdxA [Rhodospirillaceae bacterium]|nr:4-hydroxythreonine-4-phosphate dehydrogenase PdxA [Rhodospirillaceae bacterium]